MDTVGQLTQAAPLSAPFTPTEPHSSQVFVDASGRRARRLTRCGYLLGMGCVGYIGMVALGLSGTRVAALPGVPTSAENEIIAGLSGEGGSIGLHLTRAPVVSASRPAQTRINEAHAAAVRSAAAHNATLNARAALARPKASASVPVTGRQAYGNEQVLAEGAAPGAESADASGAAADVADGNETKAEEKAEQKAAAKADKTSKADSKHSSSKHGSDDESY